MVLHGIALHLILLVLYGFAIPAQYKVGFKKQDPKKEELLKSKMFKSPLPPQ